MDSTAHQSTTAATAPRSQIAVIGRGALAEDWADTSRAAGADVHRIRFGGPATTPYPTRHEWQQLLRRCDAVVIAVEPRHRVAVTEAVLDTPAVVAGAVRRVVVMPPFARTAAGAKELMRGAAAAHVELWQPEPRLAMLDGAIAAVRDGASSSPGADAIPALGPATKIRILWVRSTFDRPLGTSLTLQAITTALAFFPDEVAHVRASINTERRDYTLELHAAGDQPGVPLGAVRFRSTLATGRADIADVADLMVEGSDWKLQVALDMPQQGRRPAHDFDPLIRHGDHPPRKLRAEARYIQASRQEAQRWLAGAPPRLSPAEVLRTCAVLEALGDSLARSGRIVVPPRLVPPPAAGDRPSA